MISLVGAVFIVAAAAALILRPRTFPAVLSAAVPFPATAAVTVGGNSAPPFYVLAAVAATIAAVRFLTGTRVHTPALKALGLFLVWAGLVGYAAPRLFYGVEVLLPRGGIDQQIATPTPLAPTVSMLAQTLYLVLGAGAVLYLAQERGVGVKTLQPGLVIGTTLSALRLGMERIGLEWPSALFENYATIQYVQTDYFGTQRHKGVFPEPSYLAAFSVAAAVFFLLEARRRRGGARVLFYGLAGLAILNTASSYSGTGVAAGAVVVTAGLLAYILTFLFRGRRIPPFAPVAALALAALSLAFGTRLVEIVEVVLNKVGSQSFSHRTAADLHSLAILWETYGVGVGLGGNRPSSFIAMLLSCVGLVGTAIYGALVIGLILRASRNQDTSVIAWTLLSLLVAKSLAEPDMSTPLLWTTLGVAVSITIDGRKPTKSPPGIPSASTEPRAGRLLSAMS